MDWDSKLLPQTMVPIIPTKIQTGTPAGNVIDFHEIQMTYIYINLASESNGKDRPTYMHA